MAYTRRSKRETTESTARADKQRKTPSTAYSRETTATDT